MILKEFGGSDSGKYLVIDGQQRCMTFSILIRAILDVCSGNRYLSATQETRLVDCIYGVNEDSDGNEFYITKLTPSNPDKKSFDRVMCAEVDRPLDLDENTKDAIEKAYKFFYDYFSINSDKIKIFYGKLNSDNNSIIKISLTTSDDEQKIFDSVNSMGKSLSNADIIKNYIFQKLRENAKDDEVRKNQVTDLYNKKWDAVFYADDKKEFWYKELTVGRLKTDNLECFLKDFAIVKGIYAAKKTSGTYGLCNAFKEYINNLDDEELKIFVKEINEYANIYYSYKKGYEELNEFIWSDDQNRLLLILDNLNTTTFNPYVLKVLKELPEEAETRFANLEKFVLHRFIYYGTTKNYNQCCEKLMFTDDDAKYLKEYMEDSPVNNDSYKLRFRKFNNTQARFMIFLIEMLSRNGEEDSYSDFLKIDTYTLEHVMPQKWQTSWYDVPSYDEMGKLVDRNDVDNFIQGRNRAIKSLGNCALLTSKLNAKISNSNFATKIEGKSGANCGGMRKFAASLLTTKDIIAVYDNAKIWDEREIYMHEKKYFEKLNEFYKFE